jgi:hypothetical protein
VPRLGGALTVGPLGKSAKASLPAGAGRADVATLPALFSASELVALPAGIEAPAGAALAVLDTECLVSTRLAASARMPQLG